MAPTTYKQDKYTIKRALYAARNVNSDVQVKQAALCMALEFTRRPCVPVYKYSELPTEAARAKAYKWWAADFTHEFSHVEPEAHEIAKSYGLYVPDDKPIFAEGGDVELSTLLVKGADDVRRVTDCLNRLLNFADAVRREQISPEACEAAMEGCIYMFTEDGTYIDNSLIA